MTEVLFPAGVLIACFVAYNVGGSSTGPAFGPAVGAGVVGKPLAAALMSVCFFAGAWTIGRRAHLAEADEELDADDDRASGG